MDSQNHFSDRKRCRDDNPEPFPSADQEKKKRRKNKNKGGLHSYDPDSIQLNAENHRVCPEPERAPSVDIVIPIVREGAEPNEEHRQVSAKHEPAPPVDPEKTKAAEPNEATVTHPELTPVPDPTPPKDPPQRKKPDAKKKNVLNSQGAEPNAATAEHPQVFPKPESAPSLDLAIPMDPEKKKGAESSEARAEHPEPCPKPDPANPAPSGDPTSPTCQYKINPRNKRREKRKAFKNAKVENPKDPLQSTLNDALNQTQPEPAPPIEPAIPICPKPTSPVGQTIPVDRAIPIFPKPATPVDPEQKTTEKKKKKKKKKKSALENDGAEPSGHNAEPPKTPVQRSICPIPASPIDPRQNTTKKKRKKKSKNALKSEGAEPNKHNAEPPAETLVQRTKGLSVTRVPFKRRGESSVLCRSCRQFGHKFFDCPRLKCLTADEEICFFCGEIGHSLGKCSVSRAGGGRFAKCLFCYAHGHFSNKCPHNGHGIDPKVVAACGPINTTVKTEERSIAEVTNT